MILKLFVFILEDRDKLTSVLDSIYDVGVSGATVIDSKGIGHLIACNFPVFSGFAEADDSKTKKNNTILSVVEDDMVPKLIKAVEDITGNLEEPDTGFAFTLPVDFAKGFPKRKV